MLDHCLTEAFTITVDDCDGVFLSVDIDVCDPSHAPGTGTPEPGGLTALQLLESVLSPSAGSMWSGRGSTVVGVGSRERGVPNLRIRPLARRSDHRPPAVQRRCDRVPADDHTE